MNNSTENALALFPHQPNEMPRLSTETEPPTFTTIKNFQQKLDANMMAIDSTTTNLGHLAIVTTDEEFDTMNGGPYIVSTDPGPTAPNPVVSITPTTNNDQAQAIFGALLFTAVETIRLFNQQKQEYNLYPAVKKVARNMIIRAVEDKYMCFLKHSRTIHANVKPITIMQHLWTNYGTVEANDLKENEKRMRAP